MGREVREARSLVLLAQLRSIKRVAEAVHVSPPSVHKHLETIGLELGVPAYERNGRELKLSAAAEAILPYLKQMVAEYDMAARVLGEWRGARRGLVRIGAGPIMARYFLPNILVDFLSGYPGVNVFIQTGSVRAMVDKLSNGTIDVAFVVANELLDEPDVSRNLLEVICNVVDIPMLIVSGKPLPHSKASLSDLANMPFVLWERSSTRNRLMERYFAEFDFEPHVVVRCDDTETIKAMVQRGLGLSLLPSLAVEKEVRTGAMYSLRQRGRPLVLNVVLVARKRTYGAPAVRAFVEHVKTLVAKSAGGARRRLPRTAAAGA